MTILYSDISRGDHFIFRTPSHEPVEVFALEDDRGVKCLYAARGERLVAEVFADNSVEVAR